MFVFCFKQKTAYEMRISDWSSDVCSSDLDGIYGRSNAIRVQGWAAGSVTSDRSIRVLVFHCGDYLGVLTPGNRRADVAAMLHRNSSTSGFNADEIGRASCRERVFKYV